MGNSKNKVPAIKTGGRKKGVTNVMTRDYKERVQYAVDRLLERFDEDLVELTAKERIDALTKLLPYITPKAADTSKDGDDTRFISDVRMKYTQILDISAHRLKNR